VSHGLFFIALAWIALAQDVTPRVDPPPVDEAALAARLFEMTKPSPGERAIILFDPTYYPGITTRLREALHGRGVQTYAIAEDTPAMVATYIDDDPVHDRRERDVVETLLPLFRRADIFYWMPIRGYGDDLRWERLVAESRVRSVHFHWLLPFPGTRTPEAIVTGSREVEARALNVDLADHAAKQRRLADALRGQTIRVTTPAGTDLTVAVPQDQWFHFGNGDASRAAAERARSIRDRQIELPVGGLHFVPEAGRFDGVIVTPTINQAGAAVRDARFVMRRGRITEMTATEGIDWIRSRIKDVGPDGDKVATMFLETNPLSPPSGVGIDIGSNWENGGTNRATGMRRMSIRLRDATLLVNGRTLVRDGRVQWDQL
jgi:hypothetical protein